jgi:signal transduction histidine kinase
MSLRRAFIVVAGILAVLSFVAAGALIVVTDYLHRAAIGLESSCESVLLAEEMEIRLLSHHQTIDPVARTSLEMELRQGVREAERYANTVEERALLARIANEIEQYITVSNRAEKATASLETVQKTSHSEFEAGLGSVRALAQVNVEQSRSLADMAARWDRGADAGGTAVAILLVVTVIGLFYWLRTSAFRPAWEISRAIERYSTGDRAARATEEGPTEFRTIAHHFNDMVSILNRQRQGQLAFLAGVAHDLRNPLSALKLQSVVISPDRPLPAEDQVRQAFARVQRQVDRLDRMVSDFLDAACIESGNLNLRMEECDLRDLVRVTFELFEPAAPVHRFVLNAPGDPVLATCDPTRLEQVLNNLVSNAIKYSPRGGTVQVTVDREAGGVVLAVADQGVGMSSDDVAHVFEPFRRTGASAESIPGLGLGLFVAQRIVEAHGGRISVESAPGKGSTFRVHLPVRRGEQASGPYGSSKE